MADGIAKTHDLVIPRALVRQAAGIELAAVAERNTIIESGGDVTRLLKLIFTNHQRAREKWQNGIGRNRGDGRIERLAMHLRPQFDSALIGGCGGGGRRPPPGPLLWRGGKPGG